MKIYCSGIGGIGLSAYAALQNAEGHTVYGSDRSDSVLIADLKSQGIEVFLEQDGSHLSDGLDLFVYSEAVPEDAPERLRAKELGVRSINYFEALGEISKDYKVIAVCGTHGKSSTTAMATRVLVDAGLNPTIVVGTKLKELDGRNWRHGESDLFLLEACEYRRDFRFLSPDIVLMTNVDGDHFDAFESLEDYQSAFVDFLQQLPDDGLVITHFFDEDCRTVAEAAGRAVADVDQVALPSLGTPGRHMQENGRLVLGLADVLGINEGEARLSLSAYEGSWRRMEIKGTYGNGVTVIDDYAHHPLEITAVLGAAKEEYPGKRIVVVFQPHTHDRTLKLYDDFVRAFRDADVLVIPNIYDARADIETNMVDVASFLSDIHDMSGPEAFNGFSLEEAERMLKEDILQPNDVLLVMGAGDVTMLASHMVADQL